MAQAGDKAGLAEYLSGSIARLASAGAEFAVIPALTPHICIAELLKLSRLPIVSPVEELQRERASLETQREGFSKLACQLIEREGVQAVILAGTELALVFDESNTDFPHLDCARLHLRAVVRRALD